MQNKTSFAIGSFIKTERLVKNIDLENRLENVSDFEILSSLGHGRYARVIQVNHLQTNEKYVSRGIFFIHYFSHDLFFKICFEKAK